MLAQPLQEGDDLVCLLIRPRPESDEASVGVVGATGTAGMRLSTQIIYLRSRAAFPDWTVFAPAEIPGHPTAMGAGYFGLDWNLEGGESAWR